MMQDSDSPRLEKKSTLHSWSLWLLVVVSIILNFTSFREGHEWGDDFALYIAQAQSIVRGNVDVLKSQQAVTQSLSSEALGPDFYPWGFPALLAPVCAAFGDDLHMMKAYVYLFFLGTLAIMYLLFRSKLQKEHLLMLIALFAASPYFFVYKDNILSDVPYLFLFLITIYLIERYVIHEQFWISRLFSFILLGTLIFFDYSVRTQGILLLALLGMTQCVEFLRRRTRSWKALIPSLIPYVAFLLLFVIERRLLPTSTYPDTFSWKNEGRVILQNSIYYSTVISEFFYYPAFLKAIPGVDLVAAAVFGLTLPCAVWGAWTAFKKHYLYVVIILSSAAILLPLSFTNGLRYMFPALPFYFYFVIAGLTAFRGSPNAQQPGNLIRRNAVYIVLWPLLAYFFLAEVYLTVLFSTSFKTIRGPYEPACQELQHFITLHTTSDDLLVFHKPRIMRLLTGRNCILDNRISHIRGMSNAYLLIDLQSADRSQIAKDVVDSLLLADPSSVVFRNDHFLAFKIGSNQ